MESSQIKIEESWRKMLQEQFNMPYFEELKKFVKQEAALYKVFPPGPQIFSAFDYTPFEKARVVIIGQDPYHGAGQANGLCFSVSEGIKPPPSLVNIFKELKSDLNIPIPVHGNLEKWARQGVFLLNATLTVRQSMAGSHQGKGWEQFTDAVIRTLSEHKSGLVFLLWGRFAQAKEILIDNKKHHILKSAHPSPFSATKF
ncbi:MAG TPA: uracil-DNA glycosylase, partial [Bacteroidetes bacterium]|nr:uracil-DNA glycosylase [Bacteroidota bacterium]